MPSDPIRYNSGGAGSSAPADKQRIETLRDLVRWYPEAIAGGGGSGGGDWIGSGPDSKLLTHGPLYYDSPRTWDELERCLRILGEERDTNHLTARYWCPPGLEVRREVKMLRRRVHGQDTYEPAALGPHEEVKVKGHPSAHSKSLWTCIVHSWPSWVLPAEVDRQLNKLSELFRGVPYLPVALLEAA